MSSAGPAWVKVPVEGRAEPYFWNPGTEEVVWTLPNSEEVVWTAQKTSDGSFYFWNLKTRETTWEIPKMPSKGTSFTLPTDPEPSGSTWHFVIAARGNAVPLHPEEPKNPPTPVNNPDEWVEVRRRGMPAYYWNFCHGLSSNEQPAVVGWRGCVDDEGRWYYTSTQTGEALWVVHGMLTPPEPGTSEDPGWLEPGAAAMVQGLQTHKHYNGQQGQVLDYVGDRVTFALPDCLGGTVLALDPSKLVPLPRGAIVELRGLAQADLNGEVGTVDVPGDQRCFVRIRNGSFKSVKHVKLTPRPRLWDISTSQAPTWLQWRKEQDCLFIDSAGQHRKYFLHLPLSFAATAHCLRAWPMLVYLHGTGGTSFFTHSKRTLKSEGLQHAAERFIVVSPRCDWCWKEAPKPWVSELVTALSAAEWVDHRRIYLSGCSMGGMGTWELGAARPELYAAIAPVAAHHRMERRLAIASALRRTPIFVVHSEGDETCPFQLEEALWKLLFDGEGNEHVQVNVAKNIDHCSMYERVFCDSTVLYDWLLRHQQ